MKRFAPTSRVRQRLWRSKVALSAAVVVLVGVASAVFLTSSNVTVSTEALASESGAIGGDEDASGDPTVSDESTARLGGARGDGAGGCPVATPNAPDGPDGMGGCWPGPTTTGVPAEVTLRAYTGPTTITEANTVIDGKLVKGSLNIRASNVTIKNSKIVDGSVSIDADTMPSNTAYSLTLIDSEVDAGGPIDWNNGESQCTEQQTGCSGRSAVGSANLTVIRSNLHGGQTEVQCDEDRYGTLCHVEDSWLHGQLNGATSDKISWHLGGMLSDGLNPAGSIKFIHNRVACDWPVNPVEGGCTGGLNLIPNFAPTHDVDVARNYFVASNDLSFCTYGGDKGDNVGSNIAYRDNVFQKADTRDSGATANCGRYGPVNAFNAVAPGNVWSNNKFDDGTLIICRTATDCQ